MTDRSGVFRRAPGDPYVMFFGTAAEYTIPTSLSLLRAANVLSLLSYVIRKTMKAVLLSENDKQVYESSQQSLPADCIDYIEH